MGQEPWDPRNDTVVEFAGFYSCWQKLANQKCQQTQTKNPKQPNVVTKAYSLQSRMDKERGGPQRWKTFRDQLLHFSQTAQEGGSAPPALQRRAGHAGPHSRCTVWQQPVLTRIVFFQHIRSVNRFHLPLFQDTSSIQPLAAVLNRCPSSRASSLAEPLKQSTSSLS